MRRSRLTEVQTIAILREQNAANAMISWAPSRKSYRAEPDPPSHVHSKFERPANIGWEQL